VPHNHQRWITSAAVAAIYTESHPLPTAGPPQKTQRIDAANRQNVRARTAPLAALKPGEYTPNKVVILWTVY